MELSWHFEESWPARNFWSGWSGNRTIWRRDRRIASAIWNGHRVFHSFCRGPLPDDALINLATQNKLRDPAVLERQVRRMLADRRSDALVDGFAAQWLYLRNLKSKAPMQTKFPDWDDSLRENLRRET